MTDCDHNFIIIRELNHPTCEPNEQIEWCTKCGAIRIESYYDGRRIDHYCQPMRLPTHVVPHPSLKGVDKD